MNRKIKNTRHSDDTHPSDTIINDSNNVLTDTFESCIDKSLINDMIHRLYMGEAVILPTETVYGLAVLPQYAHVLNNIKHRSAHKFFTLAYGNTEQVLQNVKYDQYQKICIQSLLPGPFTLILKDHHDNNIGIRVPDHTICQSFLNTLSGAVLLTSANISQNPPATSFDEARSIFPDLVGLDGGKCQYSQPSMIINLTQTR